jgi:hypothetical protein
MKHGIGKSLPFTFWNFHMKAEIITDSWRESLYESWVVTNQLNSKGGVTSRNFLKAPRGQRGSDEFAGVVRPKKRASTQDREDRKLFAAVCADLSHFVFATSAWLISLKYLLAR